MSLSTPVKTSDVGSHLSMAALGQVVGVDFKNRNSETLVLILFLAFRDDKVLREAMEVVATDATATAALVATAVAWRSISEPASFPSLLQRFGDYLVLVSFDHSVRVGVCIPASGHIRVTHVSFSSPTSFRTSIILSTQPLAVPKDEVLAARDVLCGGNFWLHVFNVLAPLPDSVAHVRGLLVRALTNYSGLVYDVVRPALKSRNRFAVVLLAPFATMPGGPPASPSLDTLLEKPCSPTIDKLLQALASPAIEFVDETTLRSMLDAALDDNTALLDRVHDAEARAFELAQERDWLRERVASLEAAAPAPSAAFALSHRINTQRRASLPSSLQSPAAIVQPQRRVSLPSSLPPPPPVRPRASTQYRPRAALLGAVRPLPARRTPPHAPGPDVGQHASSTFLTPGAVMVNQFNMMSPNARLALERRYASPLLMRSYPSPAHSSPFVPESPPFDLSTPPYPPYVSPSSASSFASTRLVFDAMTPPQTERRPSPPPTEEDNELADRALNMSVDEIDDDENDAMAA